MTDPQHTADYLRELHHRQLRERQVEPRRMEPEWVERECVACGAKYIGHVEDYGDGVCIRCFCWYDSLEEAVAAHREGQQEMDL